MLKRIEEKVNSLVVDTYSILVAKDQIFDALQAASSREDDQLTAEETKACYRLAREMNDHYRAWYTASWPLVNSNLPERVKEFETFYEASANHLMDIMSASGQLRRQPLVLFEKCFSAQTGFVRSIPSAIESKALALRGILARDLMDDELLVARHLLDNGYVREAGVVGGVVLERHLKLLCDKYSVTVGDKDTLGQLNDKLRKHYPDDAEYRRVQFLNEIRISCAHDKVTAAPDSNKVGQLLSGVKGFIATIT